MIKRPIVWLLFSYMVGCLCEFLSMISIIVLTIVLVAGCIGFVFGISKNRYDQVILAIPVLFLLGYLLACNAKLKGPLDERFVTQDSYSISCEGTVASIQKTQRSYKVILDDVIVYEKNPVYCYKILMYYSEIANIQIGNRLSLRGELSQFQSPTNEGQFDEATYYHNQMIAYRMQPNEVHIIDKNYSFVGQSLFELRQRVAQIYKSLIPDRVAGCFSAMLLGEKAELDSNTQKLYEVGGIAHLLAISGLHITLLGMMIFRFLKFIFGLRYGVIGCIIFIILYGILTNFSISTNRAVVMLVVMLAAKLLGKQYDSITSMTLSAFLILLQEPYQMKQCGFLLSFGSVIGVIVVYPIVKHYVEETSWYQRLELEQQEQVWYPLFSYVLDALLFSISIYLVTFPIVLFFFYDFPVYGFFLNLIVIPLMSIVVLVGVLGGAVGLFSASFGQMVIGGAYYILRFYEWLCELIVKLPYHTWIVGKPSLGRIALYTLFTTVGLLCMKGEEGKKRRYSGGLLMIGFLLLWIKLPNNQLAITTLDVGQGDSHVIEKGEKVYLIDGGSTSVKEVGVYRILPFLKCRGITTVEYILISHLDEDHISGVKEVIERAFMEGMRIKCLVLPYTNLQDEAYREMVECAKEHGIQVNYVEAGDQLIDGEMSLTCLHPTYDYSAKSRNDSSMVLLLEEQEFSMLFAGDLEAEGEQRILQEEELPQVDIVKIGHHGSKSSTTEEFLEKLSPKIAIISVGKENLYGHPSKEVVERLREQGVEVHMTMEEGEIRIR